jgi:hypothetical protein
MPQLRLQLQESMRRAAMASKAADRGVVTLRVGECEGVEQEP